jgi:hypothetical protein
LIALLGNLIASPGPEYTRLDQVVAKIEGRNTPDWIKLLQKSKKKLILSFIELKIVGLNAMLFDFTFLLAITLKVAFVRIT